MENSQAYPACVTAIWLRISMNCHTLSRLDVHREIGLEALSPFNNRTGAARVVGNSALISCKLQIYHRGRSREFSQLPVENCPFSRNLAVGLQF